LGPPFRLERLPQTICFSFTRLAFFFFVSLVFFFAKGRTLPHPWCAFPFSGFFPRSSFEDDFQDKEPVLSG